MKTFYEWLALEFDPNRGAEGRVAPLAPHNPTYDELEAIRKERPGLGRGRSKKHRDIEGLSRTWRGVHDDFRAGRAGMRWQGSGQPEPQEIVVAQKNAHKAGRELLRSWERPKEDEADDLPSGTLSGIDRRMDWEDRLSYMAPGSRVRRDALRQAVRNRFDRGGVDLVMKDLR